MVEIPTELNNIFQECLKAFPELTHATIIYLEVVKTKDKLEGAKGKRDWKDVIVLYVPELLWGKWNALRPIIFHELAHFIDRDDPDPIFYERADEKSKKLWEMLQDKNLLKCEVVGNGKERI